MKRRLLLLSLILLTVIACGLPATTPTTAPTAAVESPATPEPGTLLPQATPVINYGQIARSHIVALTNIGPRVAGTDAEQQADEYIAGVFESAGYAPEVQQFTATDDAGNSVDSANVVAVKSGRSAQEIIVGAHYDSADVGLGADDNASGVAVMLEVAQLLQNESTPYTIRFIAFGAEEPGMLGSYAYLDQMSQADFENTIAMINLDSVTAGDIAYVYSDEGQSALRDWTLSWAFGNGYDLQTIHNVDLTEEDGSGTSDYAPFQQAGIPFIYFEATNWTLGDQDGYTQVDPHYGDEGQIWHTQYDTLAYLDATFPGRVDQHLKMFTTILYNILTQYEVTSQ